MDEKLVSLKTEAVDDAGEKFTVEYDVLPADDATALDPIRKEFNEEIALVDDQLDALKIRLEGMNAEIDRLTNYADGIDYAVAVASGVICGMIDSLFVGETVIDKDKIQKMLVEKYHTANDNAYEHKDSDGHWTSSAMYHRLDDLAHHPTLGGLVASILVRYFRLVIYIDGSDGKPHIFFADKSGNEATRKLEKEQLIKAWCGAIIGGVFLWLSNVAEKKYSEKFDSECPEGLKTIIEMIGKAPIILELLKAADTWVGHMMSDVSTPQGVPNIFLSLLKELSVLPFLRNTNLPIFVDKLYREGNHNLSQYGGVVFANFKKQAMPVLINEILVRGFYFVRHLIHEYQKHENWQDVDWNAVIPFNNRTIARMMTIATGTFTAIDMADAAIHGAAESGGTPAGFAKGFIVRVNFVGIGRFAVAVGTDVGMGIKREKLRNERMKVMAEQLALLNVKLYYQNAVLFVEDEEMFTAQKQMWIAARNTVETLDMAYKAAEESMVIFVACLKDISDDLERIGTYKEGIEEHNPGLKDDINDILKWGKK